MILPRSDRVLIQRLEEPSGIVITDKPKSIKGLVLAVGPGKWVPGEWWYANKELRPGNGKKIGNLLCKEWTWIPGYREQMEVQPGDIVLFSSKYNDLAHAELKPVGSDATSKKAPLERPLSYKHDPMIHLVTERDIFCKVGRDTKAALIGTAIESTYFKNFSVAEEAFQSK
jgi:hypothetical protein